MRDENAVDVLPLPGTRHVAIDVSGVVKLHADGVGVRAHRDILDLGEGDVPHLPLAAAVVLAVEQVVHRITVMIVRRVLEEERRKEEGRRRIRGGREGRALDQIASHGDSTSRCTCWSQVCIFTSCTAETCTHADVLVLCIHIS